MIQRKYVDKEQRKVISICQKKCSPAFWLSQSLTPTAWASNGLFLIVGHRPVKFILKENQEKKEEAEIRW